MRLRIWTAALSAAFFAGTPAAAQLLPAAPPAHHHRHHQQLWHAPKWWLPEATCIHDHEGAWTDSGYYGGGLQFLVSTWNRAAAWHRTKHDEIPFVSSTAEIGRLPPRIQLHAAIRIWLQDHRSWHEWGTAGMCGLG